MQGLVYLRDDINKSLHITKQEHIVERKTGKVLTKYGYYIYYKKTSLDATRLRKLIIDGQYETSDLEAVRKILKPGDHIVDVGAHEGFFTLFMAQKTGSQGKIYSIEPNQENLYFLKKNIAINSFSNINILPLAAGNHKEKRTFYFSKDLGAWGSLINYWDDTDKRMKVNVDSLDHTLLPIADKIDFIKIDTEGNEYNVILGTDKILTKNKPNLFIEVSLSFWAVENLSLNVMLDKVRSYGYELFVLNNGLLSPYFWPAERVFNLFAFHKSKLNKLKKIPDLFTKE